MCAICCGGLFFESLSVLHGPISCGAVQLLDYLMLVRDNEIIPYIVIVVVNREI